MVIAFPDASMGEMTERELAALESLTHYQQQESGYSTQQSTRPQTLGYGLVDSPAGQAAWIVEKFWAWTDCDGHPENVLTRDELLDNVMLYWLPGTGASSGRLYWESFNDFDHQAREGHGAGRGDDASRRRSSGRRAAGPRRASPTSGSGTSSTGAATSPRSSSPTTFVDEVRSFFRLVR